MFGNSVSFKTQSSVNKGVAISSMFPVNIEAHKNKWFMCMYG